MSFRPPFDDDIFISYARKDSSTYATGLADELAKLQYSCFIDRLGTEANAELPESLLSKLRSCALLVVVGTKWSGTRKSIENEIIEFKKTKRPIIPVDIDGSIYRAIWYEEIEGIAPEPEKNSKALDDGNPSASVVSRIDKMFKYRKRNERLRRWTLLTTVVLTILIALSVVAALIARRELARARKASAEAARQEGIAAGRQAAASADARRTQSLRMEENWADTLRYSTLLSLEAERRLTGLGVSPAEAQESLRDSLDLLPREVARLDLDHELTGVRLAPNGRYLITEERGGFLRAWETGSRRAIASIKIEGVVGFSSDLDVGYLVEKDSISVFRLPSFSMIQRIPMSGARSAKLSADGKYLAASVAASSEKPVVNPATRLFVWDARDGRQLSRISIKGQLTDFALSDEHDLLAVSVVRPPRGANSVQIWPAKGMPDSPLKEVNVPLEEEGNNRINEPVSMLSFSPDGKSVAGSTTYHAVIVNMKTGELIRIGGPDRDPEEAVGNNIEEITYVGFSPDGKSLGTMGDDATMQTWDARTGELLSSDMVNQVDGGGASDGPYFTTRDGDGGLRVIDIRTAKELARIVRREEANAFSYAPEAGRIVFYEAQQAWIYDLGSAQQSTSLASYRGLGFDMSPDGRYVAFTDYRTIVVWDAVDVREVARIQCAGKTVHNIRFSRRGKYMATAIDDNTVHVWETATGREVWLMEDIPMVVGEDEDEVWNISRLYFSPGEKLFILETAQPATTRVWDIGSGQLRVAATDVGPFSRDERFVVLSDDASTRVIEVSTGKQLAKFPQEENVDRIEFSPNNRWMALQRGKTVEVLEIGGRLLYKKALADKYPRYDFSADSRFLAIASGDERKQCQIFEAETGEPVSTLQLKKDFDSFDFSPGGRFIRTFTWTREEDLRGEVEVWEVATRRRVVGCRGVRDSLGALFSPDEGRVAIVDANVLAIRVFNLITGQQEAELLQDGEIGEQMFSDNGSLLAVTSGDRVRVWEVGSWREIARLKHKGDVQLVNFNRNGQIATINDELAEGKVMAQVWITSEKELRRRACDGVGRNLSPKEWQYNFGREKPGLTCPGLESDTPPPGMRARSPFRVAFPASSAV